MTLGAVVASWQLFSLLQLPMADICSLVSFYVAYRPNLALLREHADEAGEPSGFEACVTGEKDLVTRVNGTLWATPERDEGGKKLWTGEFDVRSGELVVVKGANGSGKSRLLDLVRGLSDSDDLDGCLELAPGMLSTAYLTYPVPVVPGTLKENLLGGAADPEVARVLDLGDLPERAITDQPLNLSLGASPSASARSWASCARSRARSPWSFSTSRSLTWTRPRPRACARTSPAFAGSAPSWRSCTPATSTRRRTASTRSATRDPRQAADSDEGVTLAPPPRN